MPTFQSIPLHPLLKKRLLEPPNDDGVSIATPQALLSRTPHALADQLMIGTNSNSTNTNNSSTTTPSNRKPTDAIWNQIDALRSQVAHAMISQTKMGTYRLRQQQLLDDRQKQLNHNNNNNDGSSNHAMVRPLVLGATINALQALQYKTERQLGQEEVSTLSTGCRALDELLSLPAEYNNINNIINNNNDNHIAKGFPRGHVCSISGPSGSGKTQLCLQLAAQAALLLSSSSSSSCPRRRVRYCYSTAGQVGTSLAHRLARLMTTTTTTSSSSLLAVEFQPIRSTTQLITILSSLEDEWLLLLGSSSQQQQQQQQQQQLPFLLVVDSLSNLEIQFEDQLGRIAGHWLKRLARQYSIWVVYVTGSTTTTTAAAADFQLACHPTNQDTAIITTLLRHPARLDQPSISLFYTPLGMTTKASPEPQEE